MNGAKGSDVAWLLDKIPLPLLQFICQFASREKNLLGYVRDWNQEFRRRKSKGGKGRERDRSA